MKYISGMLKEDKMKNKIIIGIFLILGVVFYWNRQSEYMAKEKKAIQKTFNVDSETAFQLWKIFKR